MNEMIMERIVLQSARKAGIAVGKDEIANAAAAARTLTGLDEGAFRKRVMAQYGDMPAFEDALARRLLVNKFLSEKVVPPGADSQTAIIVTNQWLSEMSGKATIRIALAEHGMGRGCGGGCAQAGCQAPQEKGNPGQRCPAITTPAESGQAAPEAGPGYWPHNTDAMR